MYEGVYPYLDDLSEQYTRFEFVSLVSLGLVYPDRNIIRRYTVLMALFLFLRQMPQQNMRMEKHKEYLCGSVLFFYVHKVQKGFWKYIKNLF